MYFPTREDMLPLLGKDWEKNATYFGRIPLHPLGEQTLFAYLTIGRDYSNEQRTRFNGINMQIVSSMLALWMFLRCTQSAVSMVYTNPSRLVSWCCLLHSLSGTIYVVVVLSSLSPLGATCRQTVWLSAVVAVVGDLCLTAVLLYQAYLVHHRCYKILFLGALVVIPAPFTTYVAWTSPVIFVPSCGCTLVYPYYFPWMRFAPFAPMNIFLSSMFLAVVYRQYCRFGSAAWERLVREGVQLILLMAITNTVCLFCAAFEALEMFSGVFLLVNW
ncbi:hypothetical protein THASP1DRAFT_31020 [Thamnocephalis sphaerospora]|uniref:Uncharacterized protein n=1 Tax=Thamnocephalis sphaerospora TaxID=78915 RepID=A0A4V1IWD4_9FUNG|nr:hypothetical protein THASP1DRAFT_31020 [Thamnocephalis sphaerospora]|eukprot:RKP07169.1 hypothetical protein THASP1DRAFT_31020 [Thamnocephalis sphaerospora]